VPVSPTGWEEFILIRVPERKKNVEETREGVCQLCREEDPAGIPRQSWYQEWGCRAQDRHVDESPEYPKKRQEPDYL
jgi:hypothetical protein